MPTGPAKAPAVPIAGRLEWWREWIAVQNDRMLAYYWQARVDELDALVQRARPAVERYATPAQRAGFFQALLMLDFRRYRYLLPDEAIDHATAYLAASEQSDDPGLLAFARFVVGFAFLWHGDQDGGRGAADRGARARGAVRRRIAAGPLRDLPDRALP